MGLSNGSVKKIEPLVMEARSARVHRRRVDLG